MARLLRWPMLLAIFTLTGTALANPAGAPCPATLPRAVCDYASTMRAVQSGSAKSSIEGLFNAGLQAAKALMALNDGSVLLETLSESDFNQAIEAMRGFDLNREEVVFAKPDPGFFLILARTRGTEADQHFFEAYKHTYPEGVWPAYIDQQTDYSGCTAYGRLELVKLYGEWLAYRREFPHHYEKPIEPIVQDIEDELASGTCACGDRQSVIKEFESFLSAYPTASVGGTVRARLQAIQKDRSDIRFACQSG